MNLGLAIGMKTRTIHLPQVPNYKNMKSKKEIERRMEIQKYCSERREFLKTERLRMEAPLFKRI